MSRFLVFNGYCYYPCGGWADFKGSYRTEEDARIFVANWPGEWWQIVDTDTGEVVAEDVPE